MNSIEKIIDIIKSSRDIIITDLVSISIYEETICIKKRKDVQEDSQTISLKHNEIEAIYDFLQAMYKEIPKENKEIMK